MDERIIKDILSDIIKGYSVAKYNGDAIFFKHLGLLNTAESEDEYQKYFKKAIDCGIPKKEDRLKEIIKEGNWSNELEEELKAYGEAIKNQQITKKATNLTSQVEELNRQIKEFQDKQILLLDRKINEMGLTAEDLAIQKSNEKYIFLTLYKDSKLLNPLFTNEDYNDLDISEINNITRIYNNTFSKFVGNAISWVGFSSVFQKYYNLCGDKPELFFQKPFYKLSFYQVDLLNEGRRFYNIVQNSNTLPESEILHNPEALISWYESSLRGQNLKQELSKEGNNISMNATKKDLEAAGIKGESMFDTLKKNNGRMSMEEL